MALKILILVFLVTVTAQVSYAKLLTDLENFEDDWDWDDDNDNYWNVKTNAEKINLARNKPKHKPSSLIPIPKTKKDSKRLPVSTLFSVESLVPSLTLAIIILIIFGRVDWRRSIAICLAPFIFYFCLNFAFLPLLQALNWNLLAALLNDFGYVVVIWVHLITRVWAAILIIQRICIILRKNWQQESS